MNIQIQFLSSVVENKGRWNQAEIAYKDLNNGKVASKKLMSFNNKDVYNTLTGAKSGEIYNVELVKNEKGFWDWTAVSSSTSVDTSNVTASASSIPARANTSPKSTYETAEERAQRQVMIVRQSSAATAVQALKTDKKALSAAEVITFAKELESYVMGIDVPPLPLAELPVIDDDIPM